MDPHAGLKAQVLGKIHSGRLVTTMNLQYTEYRTSRTKGNEIVLPRREFLEADWRKKLNLAMEIGKSYHIGIYAVPRRAEVDHPLVDTQHVQDDRKIVLLIKIA